MPTRQSSISRSTVARDPTPATLTTQLKKLEEYLGVTPFERNKHHLQPTPIGEQIIERARIALGVETLRQMVAAGVGCTLLPLSASLPGAGSLQDDLVQIRPFAAPEPARTIGLVWRRSYSRAATVCTLGTMIRDRLPPVVEGLEREGADDGPPSSASKPTATVWTVASAMVAESSVPAR